MSGKDELNKLLFGLLALLRPITSLHQEFLLNNIEIGQFLITKYKVGINNKNPIKLVNLKWNKINPLILKNEPKMEIEIMPIKDNIIAKNTKSRCLGSLSSRETPLLLTKCLSPRWITGLNIVRILGRIKMLIKKPNTLLKISLIAIPKPIPSQNIKFQKLSLLSLALKKPILGDWGVSFIPLFWFAIGAMAGSLGNLFIPWLLTVCSFKFLKSCIRILLYYWFKLYHYIIPRFRGICKEISVVLAIVIGFSSNVAFGSNVSEALTPELKAHIAYIEKQNNIPSGLLMAIAKVESGYHPYAINIEGRAVFAKNIADATYVIEEAVSSGIRNIDIGLMQVNYRWHGEKFVDIKEMLHPRTNIEYAGKLLASLYKQHGNWHKAIRYYHSANSIHHRKYSRKITIEWLKYV